MLKKILRPSLVTLVARFRRHFRAYVTLKNAKRNDVRSFATPVTVQYAFFLPFDSLRNSGRYSFCRVEIAFLFSRKFVRDNYSRSDNAIIFRFFRRRKITSRQKKFAIYLSKLGEDSRTCTLLSGRWKFVARIYDAFDRVVRGCRCTARFVFFF